MRLATLLLSVCALLPGAQPEKLPWQKAQSLPWESIETLPAHPPFGEASSGSLHASISQDGTLHIRQESGVITLRAGLPGRPLRAWRDGGIPLPSPVGTFSFPRQTLLQEGLGNFPLDQQDFRSVFKGLLWVLSDDATILTVLHPATQGLLHLHLPAACHGQIHFLKDQLAFTDGHGTTWRLSYLALLPQWIALGRPGPKTKPGDALHPFPE